MTNWKGGSGETRAQQRNQHEAPSDAAKKRPEDARGDPAQQERNRKDMGVEPDHKTRDMEKDRRGTFP